MEDEVAKKVVLLDDLDQSVIDEGLGGGTVEFSFDGKHYTVDLGVKNRDAFRKDIDKWVKVATEVEAPSRRSSADGAKPKRAPSGSGRSPEELQAVRDWAAKKGIDVAPRGRIKAEILAQFDEEHKSA
ncbi:Lsr2 family protein [Mycolicibacterium sp. PDY-3]|uniref:Lsr2 family protein n=1 Tax=Mycolicibacterium sp. PDY-3 TaxID=3376069 RepID=UPI0037985795